MTPTASFKICLIFSAALHGAALGWLAFVHFAPGAARPAPGGGGPGGVEVRLGRDRDEVETGMEMEMDVTLEAVPSPPSVPVLPVTEGPPILAAVLEPPPAETPSPSLEVAAQPLPVLPVPTAPIPPTPQPGPAGGEGDGPGTGASMVKDGAPEPDYPKSCRRRGHEGAVVISVVVGADGSPVSVSVKQSAGCAALDRSATEFVRRKRFEPARRGGQAVPSTIEWPFRFRLGK